MIAERLVGALHDGVEIDAGMTPGSGTTTAWTRSSPSQVRPTTAASRTPAIAVSARSTSSGKTFNPSGVTIISFLRPLM